MAATYYFVTDIEADGPSPLVNSMLSFASVALRDDGVVCGEFETVLRPLAGRGSNPSTMEWWADQPEAWAAATLDPQDPATEMKRFVRWVESFHGTRGFAARPLLFDGMWIDQYLRLFTDTTIFGVPYWGPVVFSGLSLDIESYAVGVFNRRGMPRPYGPVPADWLGDHPHTHRAIDDARGYANYLSRLFAIAAHAPRVAQDFLDG